MSAVRHWRRHASAGGQLALGLLTAAAVLLFSIATLLFLFWLFIGRFLVVDDDVDDNSGHVNAQPVPAADDRVVEAVSS